MIPPISADETYVTPDGRLTARGLILLRSMAAVISNISKVPAPAGGATVDTEARAAIEAIIAGAT